MSNKVWMWLFLSILILFSSCLIIWGAMEGKQSERTFNHYIAVAAFGSAFLGTACGMFIERLISQSKDRELFDLVNSRLSDFGKIIHKKPILSSDKRDLQSILGQWHQYNVTKKNGEYYWVYSHYNIEVNEQNEIDFTVTYKNNNGGISSYSYTGFVRDERVIFIGKSQVGKQPCFIELWPDLTNNSRSYHCGICINESWDGHDTLIPCILSRKSLVNKNSINNDVLDNMWRNGMSLKNLDILPRVEAMNY